MIADSHLLFSSGRRGQKGCLTWKTKGKYRYAYAVHTFNDGRVRRVWHYLGADHDVRILPTDRPVKVRER